MSKNIYVYYILCNYLHNIFIVFSFILFFKYSVSYFKENYLFYAQLSMILYKSEMNILRVFETWIFFYRLENDVRETLELFFTLYKINFNNILWNNIKPWSLNKRQFNLWIKEKFHDQSLGALTQNAKILPQ